MSQLTRPAENRRMPLNTNCSAKTPAMIASNGSIR